MKTFVIIGLLLAATPAFAQEKPAASATSATAAKPKLDAAKTPELTQAQQDQFTIAALAQENATLKYQQAAEAYQRAKEAFEKLVASLQKPGFTLQQNPQSGKLEYVPAKAPEKKDQPKGQK